MVFIVPAALINIAGVLGIAANLLLIYVTIINKFFKFKNNFKKIKKI